MKQKSKTSLNSHQLDSKCLKTTWCSQKHAGKILKEARNQSLCVKGINKVPKVKKNQKQKWQFHQGNRCNNILYDCGADCNNIEHSEVELKKTFHLRRSLQQNILDNFIWKQRLDAIKRRMCELFGSTHKNVLQPLLEARKNWSRIFCENISQNLGFWKPFLETFLFH